MDTRTEIPGHRIHRLVFLFDSDVQSRFLVGYSAHSHLALVGQAILPADMLSGVSRRRLKAGGSQEWMPHNSTTLPGTWPSDTPAARAARAPWRSPCPTPPPRSTGNSPGPPIPGPRQAPDS